MKHLLFKLQSFLVLLVFTAASAYAQKSPVDMNRFIDDLMKKMILLPKGLARTARLLLLKRSLAFVQGTDKLSTIIRIQFSKLFKR